MSMIDDITRALDDYHKYGEGQVFPSEPEWLAALVEYVRAAEACMNRPLYLMIGESFSEHKESQLNKWHALEAARRKLGLE